MTKEIFIAKIKENKRFLITTACCVLFMLLCTITMTFANFEAGADDLAFHSARVAGVADAIRGGQFPIKYYNEWHFYGAYLGSMFYGDVFLILPALLVVCGVSLKAAYVLFLYVIYFAIFITMYFLAKKYLKNKELSVLCATVFSLSQYIFSDVFRRSAIGESVAMIFFLIMFIAIYNMLHENYTKPWLYSIAFTGMVLSHMTTLIISAVVMVIVVLANSKKLFKDKSFWIKTGIAFGLFLITSLYSLASFVELYFHDTYEISDPWTFPSLNSHTILDMIGITSNYGVGVVCLLAFVLRFFIKKTDENKEELKQVDKFLIISAIVLAIVSSWFPWKYLDGLLSFLQFPWRLNTIASIMLSISLVILLKNLKNTNFKAFKIIGYLMMLFVFVYNNFALISFCSRSPYTTERSYALEWLPTNVDLFVLEKQQVLNDNGESVEYSRKQYVSDINFNCSSDSDYYIVPLIYYKGYKATLVKTNGETVELETTKDQTGLVHILTNGEEGEVLVCYAGTMIQSVTFIISLSSVVVIAIGTICYVIVKKRKQGSNSTEKVAQN